MTEFDKGNSDTSKARKVFFVGAGPGDPRLLTIRGKELLESADLVIYAGSLVNEKVLKYCRAETELISSASMDLSEITTKIIDYANNDKVVVRLQTGDPALYGAMEEMTAPLKEANIAFEVIPGVNSAFASAASLGKGLTLPEMTQTVIFTRMGGRTPVPEKELLRKLASHGTTLCIYLSIDKIDSVVMELRAGGLAEDIPVSVVHRVGWEEETAVTGTVSDIAEKVKKAGITRQAMILVGAALGDTPEGKKSKLYDADFSHGYRS